MKQLSEVSQTDLITLRSRVGEELYQHLLDALCMEFLDEFPDGLIVSLGCGFDTRFWRLGGENLNYLELEIRIATRPSGASVLDDEWMQTVKNLQAERVLCIAEGLFMYLPREEVIRTMESMDGNFCQSRLVLEVVAEKYTRGFRKKVVEMKMRKGAGSTAGDFYQFGIRDASEPESYHPGILLKEAWSYFEDSGIKPFFLKLFRHIKSITRTQYTVVLDIN